jgi:hypothetical protein
MGSSQFYFLFLENMKMFVSSGKLLYSNDGGYKLIVELEQDIANYYYSLIPKYYRIQKPRYKPHITVVRIGVEVPVNLQYWNKYHENIITFRYGTEINYDNNYYWISVWSTELERIRRELGLSDSSRFLIPPTGFKKNFHCTIANTKF